MFCSNEQCKVASVPNRCPGNQALQWIIAIMSSNVSPELHVRQLYPGSHAQLSLGTAHHRITLRMQT